MMAMRVIETPDSRQLQGASTLTFKFQVIGSNQLEAVADALIIHLIENNLLHYGYYRCRWLDKTMTPFGPEHYEVSVPFGLPEIPQLLLPTGTPPAVGTRPSFTLPGEDANIILGPEWSMDFGETSHKISKSIKCFGGKDKRGLPFPFPGVPEDGPPRDPGDGPYVDGDPAPKPRGRGIGYDPGTGEVTGLDVPDGATRLQLTGVIPSLTMKYIKEKIRRLRGHVNSSAFLGYDPGEVRFAGAQFGFKFSDGISALYHFDIKPNQDDVQVTDTITIPALRGWDYLEIFYDYDRGIPEGFVGPPDPAKRPLKLPQWAIVHQVLPYGDLNALFTP